jgi:ABC-type sugar transport system ATPase subunit
MLWIDHVSKDMGEFVLRDVSLKVEKGEYLVIIGPTGAGKTILLESIAGIYPPDSGRIMLDGREITYEEPRNRKICMVYQDYMLFPHLSVHDNIAFGLKARKFEPDMIEQRVRETATLLGISHLLHRYPETLSGGEQQRTAISRAIAMEPSVLLLDEPLSALDGRTREALRRELRNLHHSLNTSVIHITHNFEEVFSLADRVAVMNEGRILQLGEPEEVFRKPVNEFVAEFVGVENLFAGTCRRENGSGVIDLGGTTLWSGNCHHEGDVRVTVRPEDIHIETACPSGEQKNIRKGTVNGIEDGGTVVKLTVDAGNPFVVAITRQTWQNLGLGKGDQVYLTVPESAVHVFPSG